MTESFDIYITLDFKMSTNQIIPRSGERCDRIMGYRIAFVVGIFSLAGISNLGLSGVTIRGHVIDKNTRDALPGATVLLVDLAQKKPIGTATNIKGEFTINDIPLGRHVLRSSYIGYAAKYDTVDITDSSKDVNLILTMTPQEFSIGIDTVRAIEEYQRYLRRMKPEDILEIKINGIGVDNYPYSEYAIYSTFYNKADTPIYVLKDSLLIFNMKVIVTDSTGDSKSSNKTFIDYMGMRGAVNQSDLLKILPHDSIQYITHTYYNGLEGYPPGKYKVTIAYDYKRPSWISKMYITANPEVASYVFNMALRGYYAAKNYVIFDNTKISRIKPRR
jgi:CarboxypepD_reg-like domain